MWQRCEVAWNRNTQMKYLKVVLAYDTWVNVLEPVLFHHWFLLHEALRAEEQVLRYFNKVPQIWAKKTRRAAIMITFNIASPDRYDFIHIISVVYKIWQNRPKSSNIWILFQYYYSNIILSKLWTNKTEEKQLILKFERLKSASFSPFAWLMT